VPAYRFDYTMDVDSDISIAGSCYVVIDGCDLYTIQIMMPYPAGDLSGPFAAAYQNMVNNVRLNGNGPSEKIG